MSTPPTFDTLVELYHSGALSNTETALKLSGGENHPDPRVQNLVALIAFQEGRHSEALSCSLASVRLEPNAENLSNLGAILLTVGRPVDALDKLKQALTHEPTRRETLVNLAETYKQLQMPAEATAVYSRLLALSPNDPQVLLNFGNLKKETGLADEAETLYLRALQINPHDTRCLNNLGALFYDKRQFSKAAELFKQAIDSSFSVDVICNFIRVSSHLRNESELLQVAQQAERQFPGNVSLLRAIGSYFYKKHSYTTAKPYLESALALAPTDLEALANLGQLLRSEGELSTARNLFEKGLAAHPSSAELYNCRANLEKDEGHYEKAVHDYEQAKKLGSSTKARLSDLLFCKACLCDWEDFISLKEELIRSRVGASIADTPFPLSAVIEEPDLLLANAKAFFDSQFPETALALKALTSPKASASLNQEVKAPKVIGYFSADFRAHPVSQLAVGLIEHHDRSRFRVLGFYYGPPIADAMRQRVESAFDGFYDIRHTSDQDVLKLAQEQGVDIAIDLSGYTLGARTSLFAKRLAPIQMNYLGYPGSMGSNCYDYIIVDNVIAPQGFEQYYCEKLIRLQGCYQPNDKSRKVAELVPTRTELGLPENAFIFCCFNNNYKILPDTFRIWMRILKACPNSVLWLLQDNATAAKNLRIQAQNHGVDSSRLHFAPRCPSDQHLARQQQADLFLDTFPYNAHTTASDALWVGLPVLTLMGQSFASRVAASILSAAGLPEFITDTQHDYENKAISLYNQYFTSNSTLPLTTSQKNQIKNSSLFNIQTYTHTLEKYLLEL